jgi:uncharacterized cofD-like protein
MTRIVTIGGGTGTHTLLTGLKKFTPQVSITAIVTMADSGGSTGRLRDEFGYLPVGDVRMALAALASTDTDHDELIRSLFLHRFTKGEGLDGHNFGNLFLTALTDVLGSEVAAITAAARILRVAGDVVPVTTDKVHLRAVYDDGREVIGEHHIDDPSADYAAARVATLSLSGEAELYAPARRALLEADMIILGPGDLYTSLLANCVVPGMAEVLKVAPGRFVYVGNLMSRPGQTQGMVLSEYVAEVTRYCGRAPDDVVVHDGVIPTELITRYDETEQSHPVIVDTLPVGVRLHTAPVVSATVVHPKAGDVLKRSLIRHDSDRLATYLYSLIT